MKDRHIWIALALFAMALVLLAVVPRSDGGHGGEVHLVTATPTPTATPGWWRALPTPAPWPAFSPTPTPTRESNHANDG